MREFFGDIRIGRGTLRYLSKFLADLHIITRLVDIPKDLLLGANRWNHRLRPHWRAEEVLLAVGWFFVYLIAVLTIAAARLLVAVAVDIA